ncbi:hypothetical protein AAG570_004994 [Ranatra chinensis]|uniref:Costars domain-containing protein n=1 Tax=Ranatra chinensis TaxID=642074 RepID=A0ABD0XZ59_9HEMI
MLTDRINKLNERINKHLDSQRHNPFSANFDRSRSPSPRPSDPDYGRPVAGSKTDERGRKAKSHITKEILELCAAIHDLAAYNRELTSRNDRAPTGEDELQDVVTFGELFQYYCLCVQVYSNINNKVVGLLIAAKKKGILYFEKEMLFQVSSPILLEDTH